MKYSFLAFFIILFTSLACSKKVKEFSNIKVEDSIKENVGLYSLEGDYFVFTFLSPECPLSENYTRTLKELQENYSDNGVQFYYIFPGTFYPRPQIENFAKLYEMPVNRFLYDTEYQLRDYCKATTTPETYLMDSRGKIYYSGAIDNWAITLGKQRQVISGHYLVNAINSTLKGEDVELSKTRAVGCIIE